MVQPVLLQVVAARACSMVSLGFARLVVWAQMVEQPIWRMAPQAWLAALLVLVVVHVQALQSRQTSGTHPLSICSMLLLAR